MRPSGPPVDGLREFCSRLPEGAVMAEVGCYAGEASAIFLERVAMLYCIDPWETYTEYSFGTVCVPQEELTRAEQLFDRDVGEKVVKVKAASLDAVAMFDDGSLDAVYIDANHGYDHILADINAWRPKVKQGGLVSGHDYHVDHPGVLRAVAECFGKPDAVFPDGTWMKRT